MPQYTAANSTLREYDHYSTPSSVWRSVAHLIPEGTIWDPFYLDGHSGRVWAAVSAAAARHAGSGSTTSSRASGSQGRLGTEPLCPAAQAERQ